MDWKLTTARFATGVGFDWHTIPELATQLLLEGYDTQELRVLAGEDAEHSFQWDLEGSFTVVLHELGFLPLPLWRAAEILAIEVARGIIKGHIQESTGIARIWRIMDEIPEVRKRPPFDEISATSTDMYYYWPYHEERNREIVREYARRIMEIPAGGAENEPGEQSPAGDDPKVVPEE